MEIFGGSQIIEFGLGVILFFTGALAASFTFKRELRSIFDSYAAFFLMVGSFIMIRSGLPSVFVADERVLLQARMVSLFFLHPAGLWVGCQIFPMKYRGLLRRLLVANIVVAVMTAALALSTSFNLWSLHTLSSVVGGTNIVFAFGMAVREVMDGNRKVRYYAAGLLCIMVTGFSDMLVMNGLVDLPLTFQYGSFALACTVAFYMGRKLHLAHLLINNIRVLLPPKFFREVLARPDLLDRSPEQHELTVLFVDLVDSTRSIENMGPFDSFRRTSDLLQEVLKVIHDHEGIVEKTLGDGLLGYFGYRADGTEAAGHRQAAIEAAIKIQLLNAERMLQEGPQGKSLPLRIGVNTDVVTVGNIGGAERFEISAVGMGVVMAQRFEQSADPFKILAGAETIRDLPDSLVLVGGHRKHVKIKHRQELVTAFEVNPLVDRPEVLSSVNNIHRQKMNRQRGERRELLENPKALACLANTSQGWVVDISPSGIAISLDKFYARGVAIELLLKPALPSLATVVSESHMEEFEVIVQWAQEKDGRFVHGCRIVGLNPALRTKLCEAVVATASASETRSA